MGSDAYLRVARMFDDLNSDLRERGFVGWQVAAEINTVDGWVRDVRLVPVPASPDVHPRGSHFADDGTLCDCNTST